MERNTVERAIKTDIDTGTIKRGGQTQLVYVKNINRNIPTTREYEPAETREREILFLPNMYIHF